MIYVFFNGYGEWRIYQDEIEYRTISDKYRAKGVFSLTEEDEEDLYIDEESLKHLENQGISILLPCEHLKSEYSKQVSRGMFDSQLLQNTDSKFSWRVRHGEFGDDPEEAEEKAEQLRLELEEAEEKGELEKAKELAQQLSRKLEKAKQLRLKFDNAWQLHEAAKKYELNELAKQAVFLIDTKKEHKITIVKPFKAIKSGPLCSGIEKKTMQKIILGMAMDGYKYDPDPEKRNEATGGNKGSIRAALERQGIDMDEDTIRKHLTEAAKILKPQSQ